MKHIFFNNSSNAVYTGVNTYEEVGSASEARIAIFDADGTGVLSFDAGSTPDTSTDRIVIVQANNQEIITSPILEKKNIEKVTYKLYQPSTEQVTTLSTFPLPVVGEEYTIKVVDVTNGYEPYPVQSVSVTATTAVTADLLTALRDAINNHPRSLVTATATTTTLTLTGSIPSLATQEGIHTDAAPLAQSFSTSLSSNLSGVDIASVAPTFGSGSAEQLRYLEENAQGGQGFLYRMTPFQAEKPTFYAGLNQGSAGYDLVSILYRTNTTPNISSSNKYVEYILAFQQAGTQADVEYLASQFFA